jgi:hypothetical protein
MGEDWDFMKVRLKAEMAAAKGRSGKKRKAEPYSPLHAAQVVLDAAMIAECMVIANAAHANASSPSLSVLPRCEEIMEPLLKRQVKLFCFRFLECFINATLQRATRNLHGASVACMPLVCTLARMSHKYQADDGACVHHLDNILCKFNEKLSILKVKTLTILLYYDKFVYLQSENNF